jgi:hypothetical protein
MSEDGARVDRAEELARQAAAAAAKLKVGAWESVQALALISIATSLAELARERVPLSREA